MRSYTGLSCALPRRWACFFTVQQGTIAKIHFTGCGYRCCSSLLGRSCLGSGLTSSGPTPPVHRRVLRRICWPSSCLMLFIWLEWTCSAVLMCSSIVNWARVYTSSVWCLQCHFPSCALVIEVATPQVWLVHFVQHVSISWRGSIQSGSRRQAYGESSILSEHGGPLYRPHLRPEPA